jgi:hypothetical protein
MSSAYLSRVKIEISTFTCNHPVGESRDRAVGIATGYGLDD